jgi:cytidylate kinase
MEALGVSGAAATTLIAIDGPVASGKSTLGAALAERLGYTYFDSGVIYRALTWLALQRGVDVHDARRLAKLAREMDIRVERPDQEAQRDARQSTVLLNGEDVTWSIRSPEVDRNVSAVAAHRPVRSALTEGLRRIAEQGRMVMVGRDIGTVVLPEAALKIFLTASAEERARRRFAEVQARGIAQDYESILKDLHRRDALDGGREAAPMRPALDARIVDSDARTVPELVELVVLEAHARITGGEVAGSG